MNKKKRSKIIPIIYLEGKYFPCTVICGNCYPWLSSGYTYKKDTFCKECRETKRQPIPLSEIL